MSPSKKYNVEIVPVSKTYLGEGPHWNANTQDLIYVDLQRNTVHRYVPATGKEFKITVEEDDEDCSGGYLTFVVPAQSNPNQYLIGLGHSIRILEWDGKSSTTTVKSSSLRRLHVLPNDKKAPVRFNDAKCDSRGRLWAGTMAIDFSTHEKKGALYQLNNAGQLSEHVNKVDISNGLAWSLDNRTFYYVDSLAYTVDAFDFNDVTGAISNRRPIFDLKANYIAGIPDGMCIDASGNLWVAVFGGYKVLHINPSTGKLIDWINLPAKNITSTAFGGPNLDILYITCAQHGLADTKEIESTSAGSLFMVTNTGAKGPAAGYGYAGKLL